MIDFQAISDRLDKGAFTAEDMQAVGLSGFVDVFQMRTALEQTKVKYADEIAAEQAAAEAQKIQDAINKFKSAQGNVQTT